jgi:hypothetical protein
LVPDSADLQGPDIAPWSFIPLGWSKAGALAYLSTRGEPAAGCHYVSLTVWDLVQDQEVWSYDDPTCHEESLDSLWPSYAQKLRDPFTKYAIDSSRRGAFTQGAQFTQAGRAYTVTVNNTTAPRTVPFQTDETSGNTDIDAVVHSEVSIATPTLGRKVVYTFDLADSSLELAAVPGVLVSPFGDRAAILYETGTGISIMYPR